MKATEENFLFSHFTAQAAFSFMKHGNNPSPAVAFQLDRKPMIENLRNTVTENDIPWILGLSRMDSEKIAGFAFSLLRHHCNVKEVRENLENRWETASPYLKNRLMWRLLDISDLNDKWRQRFFQFTQNHWDEFNNFNRSFFGPYPQAVINLLSRLGDEGFLKSKKWIYYCSIPGIIRDKKAALAVLNTGETGHDQFTQSIIQSVKDRLLTEGSPGSGTAGEDTGVIGGQLLEFLSNALISYLREDNWKRHIPSEKDGDVFNQLPIVDALRKQVTENDIEYILKYLEENDGETAGLYLSLLKKFSTTHEYVKEWLKHRWRNASPFLKAHLMWRILDSPDMEDEWHRRIFSFVMGNWEEFNGVSSKFLGTPETILSQVIKRVGNPEFPVSKRWAYLCRFPGVVEDKKTAEALMLLAGKTNDNTPFTQEVIEALWSKFYKEN